MKNPDDAISGPPVGSAPWPPKNPAPVINWPPPAAPIITGADLETSPTIGAIAEALAAAQAEIDNAAADSDNPHFKSTYADLASIVRACRVPLAKNKIARWQPIVIRDGEAGVRTQLTHATGEFLAFTIWCKPQQAGPQALGSVITYLRRYGLAAAVGVGQEDDDGEAGVGRGPQRGRDDDGPPKETTRQPPQQAGNGKPASNSKPSNSKPAPAPAAPAPDKEHAEALEKIRGLVGKDLKWETADAVKRMGEMYQDTSGAPVTSTKALTKAQALEFLAHLETLKKATQVVVNEMKADASEADKMAHQLFGVESIKACSKEQATILLQLLISQTDGEAAYQEALVKARALKPSLFAKPAAEPEAA